MGNAEDRRRSGPARPEIVEFERPAHSAARSKETGKSAAAVRVRRGPLAAKRPGHFWLVDFTHLNTLFRSVVVGAVVDMFSRKVLAIRVAAGESDAAFAVRLLREAIGAHQNPGWIITDHGRQFTSRRFGGYLGRRRIRRRFGAVGRSNSIAIIERFSMKGEFGRGLILYRPIRAVEQRLRFYGT